MGKRFITIALWSLVAVFIINTCFTDKEPPANTGTQSQWLESFEVAAPESYDLVLENELVRTEWSATGASCGRILLKKFTPELHDGAIVEGDWLVIYDSKWVEGKAGASSTSYRRRDAFRLIENQSDFLLPADETTRIKQNLDSVTWTAEELSGGQELRFSWTSPEGVDLVKSVRLEPGNYHIDAEIKAVPRSKVAVGRDLTLSLSTGGGIRTTDDNFYPNPYVGVGVTDYGELDDVDFLLPDGSPVANRAVAEQWSTADIPFVVEGSKYFLSSIRALGSSRFQGAVAEVLFDDLAAAEDMALEGSNITLSASSEYWKRASVAGVFNLHLGAIDTYEAKQFQWYIGPKDTRVMTEDKYGEMAEVIHYADYGRSFFYRMFLTSYVAPVLLWIMNMFHSLVGNWGIAIILLTIVVKAAVFPIMRHSQIKMAAYQAKMAKVKPQLDAINKKYGKDPQKKNEETMKIYKQHKLSPPVGGCLPMFLQMPIFVGLFQALRSSILIRQEPFFGWIDDLAKPDALIDFGGPVMDFFPFSGVTTFNLLPLIMVVLWVMHQRAMPKPTDPQQAQMQKMMAFMPILFGLILYNYAAGLSLYMITSSLIGIFEQQVIRKRWPVPGSPQAKALEEAAAAKGGNQ
ncbi:MAG: membrane protein insertase YidC [Planctomycetes bacterium]|nr:membrane protein insertase YidC [Planctomycetota bacterium]MCP4771691.1 membrane protein insertase YidC [Planctomycetota bacterium]MCP4860009.1 membrane protein insertase YidC [Planctomycetota bacterium]